MTSDRIGEVEKKREIKKGLVLWEWPCKTQR